jgi:hypothetical protein
MPEGRPAIPATLKREVLVEAGHRCAIPACRQIPPEIAHIVPYKDVKIHEFDNLIALCPTCHARYDAGQIDRKSMKQYKANLAVLNSRYSDMERRVLEYFGEFPQYNTIFLPGGLSLLLSYLVKDGMLQIIPKLVPGIGGGAIFTNDEYRLTDAGREFVNHLMSNEPLDLAVLDVT